MAADYAIPAAPLELCEEIKKSRFITLIAHAPTVEAAKAWIGEVKRQHPTARHHCWAFVAGAPQDSQVYGFSDDGEPSGTAGMPCLDVIVKNEIYDVCVVVTRYFGGVLLGTGGLVRAYSHGAKIALDAAKIVMMQNCLVCSARCTYNRYGKVSALVTDNGGAVDDTVYEGDVLIKFHIKPDLLPQLNKKLADATAGEVQAVFDEEKRASWFSHKTEVVKPYYYSVYLADYDVLDDSFDSQKRNGDDSLLYDLKELLHVDEFGPHLVQQYFSEEFDIILMSRIGSVWPMLRAHNLLNKLHALLGHKPLVLFYPGEYDGQMMQLFGKIPSDSYYRAFKLVP